MKAWFASVCCFFCLLPLAFGWQPLVAVHDSELTRALSTLPAVAPTPMNGGSTTGFQWWVTNWNYFTISESVKETFRSDGTTFAMVGDSNIVAGQLLDADGTPKYPIVISLASEAISDAEIADLTNYVAAGGFLFVGSSSFTRNTDGTARGDFAIAAAMGLHTVNPGLTNWFNNITFTKTLNNPLVANIPEGTLFWEMPSSADEISWPSVTHLDGEAPDAQMPGLPHLIWQVQPSDASVVAVGDGNLPYLTVTPFGKGCFIYDAAMQPLLGHGSWAPGMYAYDILRSAVEWAFQSARLPVVRLSPWPFAYNAAVMFRHDMEAIPARISLIEGSAAFEYTNGASGDYYFCTGTLRLDMPGASNSVIAGLQQAVASYGATIGPHNGGLTNINLYVPQLPAIESPSAISNLLTEGWLSAFEPYTYPVLFPLQTNGFSYDYWHWGPDEILDVTTLPPGFASGAQYALTSLSNSFSDIAAWQLTNNTPRAWCSPYFNATREPSYQLEQDLNVKITSDDKLTPFPHWIFSTQTAGKYYSVLSEPVSDWFVGPEVSQSMESGHTSDTIQEMVDFYYNLGALINLYCHTSPVGDGPDSDLDYTYETYSLSKPLIWSTNAAGIYAWWLQRSNVQISASYSTNTSPPKTTVSISGSSNPNMTVDFVMPAAGYASLQITTNGVVAGAGAYRTNGQTIKLLVGNSVTNAAISFFITPIAPDNVYPAQMGTPLTVPAPGLLANATDESGRSLTAVLASRPANGALTFNPNGSFSYQSTNNFTGVDTFTYQAWDGQSTSTVAAAAIEIAPPGQLFLDNFTHAPLWPWVPQPGTWTISNDVLTGTNPPGGYADVWLSNNWTDYVVQARVSFSATNGWGGGIGGRVNDPVTGTHYAAWVYPEGSPAGGPSIRLEKYASWTDLDWQTMAQAALTNGVGTTWHTLALAFQGTNLLVYFDGIQVLATNDNQSYGAPYTNGGICADMWEQPPFGYTMSLSNINVAVFSSTKPTSPDATAAAAVANGIVVGATMTGGGSGYTNMPGVRIIGGGGSGAQAVAVVSNGVVTGVDILNGGTGYSSAPLVVIEPPFIPNPHLSIAPMSSLFFSNLISGSVYQLQQLAGSYWSNQPVSFTATNILYTQVVPGKATSGEYQLTAPPPAVVVSPSMVLPMVQLGSTNLAPYDNYQIQFRPALGATWGNWNGGLFSPAGVTNAQVFLFTNATGFFRLQYVP